MDQQIAPPRRKNGLGYRGERRALARKLKIDWRRLPRVADPKQRGSRRIEIVDMSVLGGRRVVEIKTFTFRLGALG